MAVSPASLIREVTLVIDYQTAWAARSKSIPTIYGRELTECRRILARALEMMEAPPLELPKLDHALGLLEVANPAPQLSLTPRGFTCTCADFQTFGECTHSMFQTKAGAR